MNPSLRGCWLACCVVLGILGHLLWTVTGGLEHWTFESLRRAQAERGELRAADIVLRSSAHQPFRPWGADARPGAPDVLIVDFIFTRCPTVCLSLGSTFQQLQTQLQAGDAHTAPEDVQIGLLSISFDTAHDDADALASYARIHRAQPARWAVGVPMRADDTRALLRSLGVVVIADGWGGFTHNAGLHLIDRQGRLLAIHDREAWPHALAHARRVASEVR
jgi:protein SCO1/2